jgi:DNA-binding transcriptional regulator YiaG
MLVHGDNWVCQRADIHCLSNTLKRLESFEYTIIDKDSSQLFWVRLSFLFGVISMSTFATQLKSEIGRIAKKETRAETSALKKSNAQFRSDIAALKRRLSELESLTKKLHKQIPQTRPLEAANPTESLRFRVDGFAALRKKLGLTANEMGALIGVSGQSIYKWEQGKAKPRASQLKAISAVRKMGKREVEQILTSE